MNRKEFELKLREAGFESLESFIDETKLEKTKIKIYLEKNIFPSYFDYLFDCLIKIKGIDFANIEKKQNLDLQNRLNELVLENKKLMNELEELKKENKRG